MIKYHILSYSGSRMQKILLYFILSIICIYLSLCKGILPHRDLHPPTEISSERQDISGKKHLIQAMSQLTHPIHLMSQGTDAKKIGGRNLSKALKEGTWRYPWQPVSSNFKSGHTNCHTDLIIKLIKNKTLCLKCDLNLP